MSKTAIPEKIRVLIDACPEQWGDDPTFEPLREWLREEPARESLLQRARTLDRWIGDACRDIAVPSELASRLHLLVDQVREGRVANRADMPWAVEVVGDDKHAETDRRAAKSAASVSKGFSNPVRWGLLAASMAAGLLFMAYVTGWFASPQAVLVPHQVASDSVRWIDSLHPDGWREVVAPQRGQLGPAHEIALLPRRWQPVVTPYGQGVAYDFTPQGGPTVYQFSINTTAASTLSRNLPPTPMYRVGDWTMAACHRDGVLYVLLVKGPAQDYQRVIGRGVVAMNYRYPWRTAHNAA